MNVLKLPLASEAVDRSGELRVKPDELSRLWQEARILHFASGKFLVKANFELDFQVEAKDGKQFDALVVTQEMLDSDTPLQYQKADGVISGKIISDKNVYQNYFLLLKSECLLTGTGYSVFS